MDQLILTKADKGNSVTILTKSDYITKVGHFIQSSDSSLLKSDPTDNFQRSLNKLLQNCPFTIPPNSKARFLNMNPSTLILYGLPKLLMSTLPHTKYVNFLIPFF